MYEIIFSEFFEKQWSKLPYQDQERVLNTLKRLQIRPYAHVRKVVGSKYYRMRIGYYRVILDIIDDKLKILIIEIGHRRNIYKK